MEIFFLALNALTILSTFPQFAAKLISLYLFPLKKCEKVSKNLLITLWISLFLSSWDMGCGYYGSY